MSKEGGKKEVKAKTEGKKGKEEEKENERGRRTTSYVCSVPFHAASQ